MSPSSRPILFSAELVRAILNGQKSVTRRVVLPSTAPRLAPEHMEPWIPVLEQETDEEGRLVWRGTHPEYPAEGKWFTCPYGAPGDELWVREAFRLSEAHEGRSPAEAAPERDRPFVPPVRYEADGAWSRASVISAGRLRPSIHMPRWASRITLVVTDVRVERLDEINEPDAIDEGVDLSTVELDGSRTPRDVFAELWERINGPRGFGWDEDPWVWRLVFRHHRVEA